MLLKYCTAFLLSVLSLALSAQPKSIKALNDSVRFRSKIKGYVLDIRKWNDSLGTNHLVLTETATRYIETDSFSGNTKYLYAYHFLNTDSLLWKVMDHVKDCDVDITVEFRDKATTITDLDNNGIAETWIMYSLACRGDVSGSDLKMIMHQGKSKHIIRGTAYFSREYSEKNEYQGKYVPDVSFVPLSKIFKNFAKNLWQKHLYDWDARREE